LGETGLNLSGLSRTVPSYSALFCPFLTVLTLLSVFLLRWETPKNQGTREIPGCELFRNVRISENVKNVTECGN